MFQESTCMHEMMNWDVVVSAKNLAKEKKNQETPVREKKK